MDKTDGSAESKIDDNTYDREISYLHLPKAWI